jgi:glucose/arabinose dehydrogenase
MRNLYRQLLCGALTVAASSFLTSAWVAPATAQQKKVPGWAQGRPAELENSPLAPHAGKMTVTPADQVPVGHIRLPPGFKAEVWASGMPGARMMAQGDKGTMFFGSRGIGRVYAVTDNGGTRNHKIIVEGLTQPNGVAFKDGSLYVIAINKVLRFDNIEDNLDNPKSVELTDAFNLPPDKHHGWKFLKFGPDGKLYMQVGAPCNGCEVDKDKHAIIVRYNRDGSGREIVARGVRNSVGFDFHPETGELWFTDNDQDWISEHGPQCELNRVSKIGENFGFPYCHGHGIIDSRLGKPDSCDGVTLPAALMGAHTAPLGMRFYTGNMFPAEYKNAIFIARRGSWNRTTNVGFDVVVAHLSSDGKRAAWSPFLTGLLNTRTNEFSGRPVDVHQLPDGSLLVADEQNGAVYRISYHKPS